MGVVHLLSMGGRVGAEEGMVFGEGSPLFGQHYICNNCNTVFASGSKIAFNFSREAKEIFAYLFLYSLGRQSKDESIYTNIQFSRI